MAPTATPWRARGAGPARVSKLLVLTGITILLLSVPAQAASPETASSARDAAARSTNGKPARTHSPTGREKRTAAASSTASTTAVTSPYSSMVRGTWLDEGVRARGVLAQWEDAQTYSFLENATLRVRVDPLNSTLQPYLIRRFGQSPEAHAVHAALRDALAYLQDYAAPLLRPLFWAWSDLRVYVRGTDVQLLRFSYARTPGLVCQSLQYLANVSNALAEYVAPAVVSALQTGIHAFAWALCENCWNGCPLECSAVGSTDSLCVLELSPYHAPSVTVAPPAKPYITTTMPTFTYSLTFYTYLSTAFVQNFFLGLVLFYSAPRLSRSRAFHYLLGAAVGITFSVVLALYFVSRQTKSASRMLPGVQLLQSLGSMVSFFAPVTVYVVLPQVYKLLGWALGYLVDFWAADEVLGVPHLGKIYFVSFGVIGCALVWWNQWGASPRSEEQQDAEEIEAIGYLEEELPLTTAQSALARLLQLLGLMLLFESTSSTETSLLIVVPVLLTGLFEYLGSTAFYWYHYEAPGRHTQLISKKEYQKQAETETEKALKQLQAYLRKNPDELEKVKEENEIRLRRFAKGRDHLEVSSRDPAALKKPAPRSRWFCAVQ